MSTILNIRNLKLPGVSRTALVVGTVVVLAIVGGLIGWNMYKKLSTNTVVAYFPDTLALPFDPLGRALFRRVRRSGRVGRSVPAETRDLVCRGHLPSG